MKKLLCILTILLFAKMGYAVDYTVSGATGGSTAFNGDYTADGSANGKSTYKHATQNYWLWWDGGTNWILGWLVGGNPATQTYYRTSADVAGVYTPNDGEGTPTVAAAGASDYTVTFTDGKALNGINIAIYEDSGRETEVAESPLTTAGSGTATIDLANGTYYYTASILHYTTQLDDFTVNDTPLAVPFTMLKKLIKGFLFFLQ
jgi:hypothetical protein